MGRDAAPVEIKFAFRKLAIEYHPDKQKTDEDRQAANHIFAKLSEAYEIITDKEKCDAWLAAEERRKQQEQQQEQQQRQSEASAAVTTHQQQPHQQRTGHVRHSSQSLSSGSCHGASTHRQGQRGTPQYRSQPPHQQGGLTGSMHGASSHRPHGVPHHARGSGMDRGSSHGSAYPRGVPAAARGQPGHPQGHPHAATGHHSAHRPMATSHHQHSHHGQSRGHRQGVHPPATAHDPRAQRRGSAGYGQSAPSHDPRAQRRGSAGYGAAPERAQRRGSAGYGAAPERAQRRGSAGHGRPAVAQPSPLVYYPTPQEVAAANRRKQQQQQQAQSSSLGRRHQQDPVGKPCRDPFELFDKLMIEEFGKNYKASKAWKGGSGVKNISSIKSFKKKNENANAEFRKLDVDGDRTLSKNELSKYISSHSELWKSLSKSLDLPVAKCIEVATNVAFAMALKKEDCMNTIKDRDLTKKEFTYFHKNYILNEKGSEEFFLRTIFAVFDLNKDGVLSTRELDRFLDIFYKAKDVFRGSMRLPDRKSLNQMVQERCDRNKDGALGFSEVRDLLVVAAVVTADN